MNRDHSHTRRMAFASVAVLVVLAVGARYMDSRSNPRRIIGGVKLGTNFQLLSLVDPGRADRSFGPPGRWPGEQPASDSVMGGWLATPEDCPILPSGRMAGGKPSNRIAAIDASGQEYALRYGAIAPNMCWFSLPRGYTGSPRTVRLKCYVSGIARSEIRLPPLPSATEMLPATAVSASPTVSASILRDTLSIQVAPTWHPANEIDVALLRTTYQRHRTVATIERKQGMTPRASVVSFPVVYATNVSTAEVELTAWRWKRQIVFADFGTVTLDSKKGDLPVVKPPNAPSMRLILRTAHPGNRHYKDSHSPQASLTMIVDSTRAIKIESLTMLRPKPEELGLDEIDVLVPSHGRGAAPGPPVYQFKVPRSRSGEAQLGTAKSVLIKATILVRDPIDHQRYRLPVKCVES